MSKDVTIYHNSRCSKSREALDLLRERGINPTIIEYMITPLGKEQLKSLIHMLNCSAHDILRTKEAAYKELRLSPASSHAEIIGALLAHPILLERPIVVCEDRAIIGRPPEQILAVL